MDSKAFVDVIRPSRQSHSVVMGDMYFELLKETAINRHGSCNLYSLISTLEDSVKPLGLRHSITLGGSRVVYRNEIQLDSSLSLIAAQVLKRIFESACVEADITISANSISISLPVIT
jgi:hypothetical protein